MDDRNSSLLAYFLVRKDAGIGLEDGILRAEREDLEFTLGHERHAQIVERHELLHLIGIHLGEIRRDVAAHGMSHHGQVIIIGVGLNVFHFARGKADVGNATLNLRQPANIEFADFRHHRCIGRQVMLDADRHKPAHGKDVRQKSVLGEFDGVAVVEDRHRQLDHAGVRLHFLVPPHRDVHGNRTVVAARVVEGQCLVADRPFAPGEIGDRQQRAKRNQYRNPTLHARPRRTDPGGPGSIVRDSAVPCR